jgi:hypothetical protein
LIFCSTVVACRNPLLAAERARKREDLLTATEALLAKDCMNAQHSDSPGGCDRQMRCSSRRRPALDQVKA